MKDTLKRLTCMLLALIMVAGMFPVSVFAEAGDDTGADEPKILISNVFEPFGVPETSDMPGVALFAADAADGLRSGPELTSDSILQFVQLGLGTLTLIHKATGQAITPENPAKPGEQVQLTVIIHENNDTEYRKRRDIHP